MSRRYYPYRKRPLARPFPSMLPSWLMRKARRAHAGMGHVPRIVVLRRWDRDALDVLCECCCVKHRSGMVFVTAEPLLTITGLELYRMARIHR